MIKTKKFFSNSLLIFTGVIIFLIAISRVFVSVRYTIFESNTNTAYFYKFFNPYTLILSFVFILMINKIKKALKENIMNILVFIIPIIIGLIANYFFSYTPSFDSKYCFDIAYSLQNGVSINDALKMYDNYLYLVPYQYGYICFIRLFIMVFGNHSLSALKVFQIIFNGVANLYLYKITILYTKKNVQKHYLLLTLLWIVPYLASPYIYGFSLGLSLSIISLYNFILFNRSKKYKYFLNALGLSLFSTILKMNYSILLIAYIIYFIIFTNSRFFKRIINSTIVAIILLVSMNSYNILFKAINGITVPNFIPTISRLIMTNPGLTNEDYSYADTCNPGFFNGYIYYIAEKNNFDIININKDLNSDFVNMIHYISNNKSDSLKYYLLKNIAMWDSYDYLVNTYMTGEYSQNTFSSVDMNIDNINSISNIIEGQIINIATFLILVFALIYFVKYRNSKHNEFLIIVLWFIGGFLYHLIFEAKPIYIYPYITVLMPLATIGINDFCNISSSINIKSKSFISIISIILVCLITIIYNKQSFTINLFDRDIEESNSLLIDNPVEINQYFKVDFDFAANQITLPIDGNIINNEIAFNLYEDDNEIFSNKISGNNIFKDNNNSYLSINFDEICFSVDKTYKIEILINSISQEFSLKYNDYTYNSKLLINGLDVTNKILNFKINRIEKSRILYYQTNKLIQIKDMYYK